MICEVCNSNISNKIFLNLGKQPLCDDLIKINSKKISRLYKLELIYCNNCFTVHQKYQVPKKKLFPKSYHYRSNLTKDVLDGMKNFSFQCTRYIASNKKKPVVLDIGSNDGSLLDLFKKKGYVTIGVEPTNACKSKNNKKHNIYNNYFDLELALKIKKDFKEIDLITFTNVFAHIEDLIQLIKSLKILIGKNTILAIENHYLGSIVNKFQFDTFYHEHPRTYSLNSFNFIAKKLELPLFNFTFTKRYGGNIRVFLGNRKQSDLNKLKLNQTIKNEKKFKNNLYRFQKKIDVWKIKTKKLLIKQLNYQDKLYFKAFPGRASILINLLELNHDKIYGVFEKNNSPKVGNYIPGTRIKIFNDKVLFKLKEKPKVVVNLAWHISNEIRDYLKKNKIKSKVLDIL